MALTFPRMPHPGDPETAHAPRDGNAPAELFRVVADVATDVAGVLRELSTLRGPAAGQPEIAVVTDLDRLAVHAADWDRIAFAGARYRPQASFAYVAAQLEHLRAPGAPWACVVASHAGEFDGALPFLITPTRSAGIHGVHLDAATLEADLVVRPGREAAVATAIFAHLARAAPRGVSLGFGELQDGGPTVSHFRALPGPVVLDVVGRSSFLRLPRSYDEFLAHLSSSFRQNLRRLTKKFFALPGASVEFVPPEQASEAHLAAFIAVEGTGWKASEGNAICRRPELAAYYQSLARRVAGAGALQWSILRVGDRVAAVFLAIKMGRRLALDKIAYDDALSDVAPGNVLMGRVIEHAIASGAIDEIDFLTDHDWNRRWQAETRTTFDVTVYRPSVRALVPWFLPAITRRELRGSPLAQRVDELRGRRKAPGAPSSEVRDK
jgi:CelD/BcsL family acetyltransferase involved in cellulose biosynthesis